MKGDLRSQQSERSVILPAILAAAEPQLCVDRYHGVVNTPGVGWWPEL